VKRDEILFDKIIKLATENVNVRVVEMNGSRANPYVSKDDFQDFDIVFYVQDVNMFKSDFDYEKIFGEVLVKQTADDQRDYNSASNQEYVYLIQFKDGSRLDLTLLDICHLDKYGIQDSLSKIILNKDGRPIVSRGDESSYFVQPPEKKDFSFSVNEFFWVTPYVAKGLARNQIFYSLKHIGILRTELERVLDWWIGMENNFEVSVGKAKSRYEKLLPQAWYEVYKKSYCDYQQENINKALYLMANLYDEVSNKLAKRFNFDYDINLKNEIIKFLSENYNLDEE
jgi:aminoglycoside 6-adenylyltransferase